MASLGITGVIVSPLSELTGGNSIILGLSCTILGFGLVFSLVRPLAMDLTYARHVFSSRTDFEGLSLCLISCLNFFSFDDDDEDALVRAMNAANLLLVIFCSKENESSQDGVGGLDLGTVVTVMAGGRFFRLFGMAFEELELGLGFGSGGGLRADGIFENSFASAFSAKFKACNLLWLSFGLGVTTAVPLLSLV